MNTSSAGAAFGSLLPKKHFGTPPPAPVSVPSAFAKRAHTFAPPPTRTIPATRVPTPPPEPEEDVEADAEPDSNEWVKALYDYSSTVSKSTYFSTRI